MFGYKEISIYKNLGPISVYYSYLIDKNQDFMEIIYYAVLIKKVYVHSINCYTFIYSMYVYMWRNVFGYKEISMYKKLGPVSVYYLYLLVGNQDVMEKVFQWCDIQTSIFI